VGATRSGRPVKAAEGPSVADTEHNDAARRLGRNATDYVITPRWIYRILGRGNVQRIAPTNYLWD